jgi:hypothetical protein
MVPPHVAEERRRSRRAGGVLPAARRLWIISAVVLASVLAGSVAYLVPPGQREAAAMPLSRSDLASPGSDSSPPQLVPVPPGAASAPGVTSDADPPPLSADPIVVRYGFEGLEAAGGQSLRVHSAGGGAVDTESHGGGLAVRFPPPCAEYGDRTCPRVILETPFATNPGPRPLRYGATVRLAPSETSDGENVLQKGFSHGHSQFKLQVDGAGGQPSCVLVGTASRQIHAAIASVSVSDGQWHTIECSRTGSSLTITVDGAVAGQAKVPASLSIVNNDPLRIGGKGISANNDQFHGALDDVFVSIGCGASC